MIRSQEKLKLDFNGKYVSKFLRDMELVIKRDSRKLQEKASADIETKLWDSYKLSLLEHIWDQGIKELVENSSQFCDNSVNSSAAAKWSSLKTFLKETFSAEDEVV